MVKNFTFNVKSVDDVGTFEGILSAYDVTDRVGDRVIKGAFTESIKEFGSRRPLLFSHRQDEPVGSVELVDTETSLNVKGRFNLAVNRAREVYELMRAGDLDSMSIGYTVKDSRYASDGVRELTAIELLEASIVAVPANPSCVITSVKTAQSGNMTGKYSKLSFLEDLDDETREKAIKELDEFLSEDEEKAEEPETSEPESEQSEEKECQDEEEKSEDAESQDEDEKEDDEQEEKSFNALISQINAITEKLNRC